MKTVGSYQLKTHLAQFLALVMKGETIEVTKHGKPVAHIVPASLKGKQSKKEAIAMLKSMKVALDGTSLRALIDAGRKY
jgi:prevent-host-death family protein